MNAVRKNRLYEHSLGSALAVLLLFSVSKAHAQIIQATNYDSVGVGDVLSPNIPYNVTPGTLITGDAVGYDDEVHQGYASFATSSISGKVTGAALEIIAPLEGTLSQSVTLNLYLYASTSAPTADATSFTNMVSGTLIGSYVLDPSGVPLDYYGGSYRLNSAGLAALNQDVANGSSFALVTSLSQSQGALTGGLFRIPDNVQLDVTTAAPEPSTWTVTLAGLGVLAVLRSRARRAT